jgi:hypothetical protein
MRLNVMQHEGVCEAAMPPDTWNEGSIDLVLSVLIRVIRVQNSSS